MTPELSIIIVNWNAAGLLQRCLESIARHPPRVAFEILVVDNASTDDSLAMLRSSTVQGLFPAGELRTVANPANDGFAKANNLAFRMARGPALFLLNPDTEVHPGAVDALLRTLRSGARIGACAPMLLNTDGTLQPSAWRNPPSVLTIFCEGLRLYRLVPGRLRARWLLGEHWDHAERRDVPSFSGAAILMKREVIYDAGAFDESFEMYGEDVEWCLRAGRKGWRLVFEPAARVVHHGGHSALKRWTDQERRFQEIEAWFRSQRHVLPPARFLANSFAYLLVINLLRLRRALVGEPSEYLDRVATLQKRHIREAFAEILG